MNKIIALILTILFTASPAFAAAKNACELSPGFRESLLKFMGGPCEKFTAEFMANMEVLLLDRMDDATSSDFAAFPGLQKLQIEGSSMRTLPAGLFRPLGQLHELQLEGDFSEITDLSSDSLQDLKNLTTLDISGFTKVISLPADLLKNQKKLLHLSIDAGIESLPQGIFRDLIGLKKLSLTVGSRFGQMDIPVDLLTPLVSLASLRLQKVKVPAGALRSLSNLRDLDLSLTSLEPGAFQGLEKVTNLYLLDHKAPIGPEVFQGLADLNYLYIMRSNLGKVPANTFAALTKLKSLSFTGVEIASLAQGQALNGLSSLETFNMERSKAGSALLTAGMFTGSPRLKRIELISSEIELVPENFVQGLKWLKVLDLSSNKIREVKGKIVADVPSLEALMLDFNELETMDPSTISEVPASAWLGLRGSRLSQVEKDALVQQHGSNTIFK